MATMRVTLGSILGTVTTTANAVTGLVDAVNDGVGMLSTSINLAAHEQKARALASKATLVDRIIQESAEEEAERNVRSIQFCLKSTDHAAFYSAAQTKFETLFKNNPL